MGAEGEHPQWQFAKLGACAFLIETHTEFQPSYDSGLAEAAMVWPGITSSNGMNGSARPSAASPISSPDASRFVVWRLRSRRRPHVDTSPAIVLPASGTLTMTFSNYLAHGSNSSSADYLRVSIVGTTQASVFQELGNTNDDDGVWATATVDLSAFAGQSIRILVEAADAAGASLVEAAIDDVKIIRQ